MNQKPENKGPAREVKGIGLPDLLLSILAALFGIQSNSNRQKDFSRGTPAQFIIAGIFGAAVLITLVLLLIKLVLGLSGLN